jgi:hypothetical protein
MRTGNADQSIFNSLLNLAGCKSFTDKCVDCHFYVTSFYHPIENTLRISLRGNIFSITPRLYPRWSATKQHQKNPKVDNPIPIHDPLGWQTALAFGKSKDATMQQFAFYEARRWSERVQQ